MVVICSKSSRSSLAKCLFSSKKDFILQHFQLSFVFMWNWIVSRTCETMLWIMGWDLDLPGNQDAEGDVFFIAKPMDWKTQFVDYLFRGVYPDLPVFYVPYHNGHWDFSYFWFTHDNDLKISTVGYDFYWKCLVIHSPVNNLEPANTLETQLETIHDGLLIDPDRFLFIATFFYISFRLLLKWAL